MSNETDARMADRAARMKRLADRVAVCYGVLSSLLGIGAAMLIAFGIELHFSLNRPAPHPLLYRLTRPRVLIQFLMMAAPAAIFGGLALAIVRNGTREARRVSAARMAVRFSTIGLGCAALIAALVAAAAAYRWLTWG